MKSDEFSGKMLDDHIEVFCYCNFNYYRNLFWCFCISIYEKEKGSCSGQYCLYWNYVCAVSDTAADWQFFCIYAGSCGCISCDVCTGQKKHLSENISCSDIFSIRWLAVAMADRLDDFITKALVLGIRLQEDNGCNMDFMLEREFWILCFVSFSLQLQSV